MAFTTLFHILFWWVLRAQHLGLDIWPGLTQAKVSSVQLCRFLILLEISRMEKWTTPWDQYKKLIEFDISFAEIKLVMMKNVHMRQKEHVKRENRKKKKLFSAKKKSKRDKDYTQV